MGVEKDEGEELTPEEKFVEELKRILNQIREDEDLKPSEEAVEKAKALFKKEMAVRGNGHLS